MTDRARGFIWYELMTHDVEAAAAFYRAAIGWNASDFGGPNAGYKVLAVGERGIGGIMAMPADVAAAGARPGWMGYVGVPDTDDAAARIAAAGGIVRHPPQDIEGVGRFALVADPQGAHFLLLTPQGGERPPLPPGTPGGVGWHELYAAEWSSAFAFYQDQFGWTRVRDADMGPLGIYQVFATGGEEAAGGMMTKPDPAGAPGWVFYFDADGIDAAAERVSSHGGAIVAGPMEVPDGSWIVHAVDPQGAFFALVSKTR
jgi:predicted enzyme related to lactoylglutathione lyase